MKYTFTQLLFFCIGLFSACSNNGNFEQNKTTNQEEMINDELEITLAQFEKDTMSMTTPSLVPFFEHIKTTGKVDVPPQYIASVSTFYTGYVSGIKLLEGEYVRKGTILFMLQNPEFVDMQQAYLEAKEQLTYLQNEYERQKVLSIENIASQKNFLKAKSDFSVTNTRYNALQKKLELIGINTSKLSNSNLSASIAIVAPIAGYISEINVSQGQILSPNDVALKIVNTEHLHVEIMVFEQDIAKIKKGQKIDYTLAGSTTKASGDVYLVGHAIPAGKSTINVHGHIDRTKVLDGIYPGMFVEVKILTKTQNLLGIPVTCVAELEGKSYVLILQDKTEKGYKLTKREVTVTKQCEGFVHVDGLKVDDIILQNGKYELGL